MEDKNKIAKEKRENVESRKIILRRNGQQDELSKNIIENEKDPLLKSFAYKEAGIIQKREGKSPLHVDIMRRMELVDYEPSSDIGHLRFYPKGALMMDLLQDLAEDIALNKLGALKIETPLLYRAEKEDIAEQAASFHERDYRINLENRELILRFAGDFGLFSMMKDARATYKNLPIRVYEISKSFRLEQSGELSGLKRLRAFTMPDIHCFCGDLKSGLKEYAKLYKFYDELLNEAGLPFAIAFRNVKDFWGENKKYLEERLNESKKDGVIEILEDMKHYWNLKHEFNYIDSLGEGIQLSTVQLDISDSERYGLSYKDKNDSKKPFTIVHSSMGSLERILGAVLEERGKEIEKGEKPAFPYWLNPTQLRLIPVNEEYNKDCEDLANSFEKIRVDIDDREENVGKKVRNAEKEWVAGYVVVGEKEKQGLYTIKTRGKELQEVNNAILDKENINNILINAQSSKPYKNSYLPRKVSQQLRFRGNY